MGSRKHSFVINKPIMKVEKSNDLRFSRSRTIAYWITTALVAANLAAGAVIDLLQIPYIRAMTEHLGYPMYFTVIVGLWEILGTIALLVPGFPVLKEWAYAGAFFLFTGAVASRLAVGDGAGTLVPPAIFAGLVVASWALRPSSRRL
jgi:hypothetical protein